MKYSDDKKDEYEDVWNIKPGIEEPTLKGDEEGLNTSLEVDEVDRLDTPEQKVQKDLISSNQYSKENTEDDEKDGELDKSPSKFSPMSSQKTQKQTKVSPQLIGVVVILFLLIFVNVIRLGATRNPLQGSQVYSVGDAVAAMEEREQERQSEILEDKADLDRHYGNGRYAKDYSEISQRLNEAWIQKISDEFGARTNAQFIVRGEIVFFNDVLDEAIEQDLSLDDLLKDPHRSVKDMDMTIDAFADHDNPFSDDDGHSLGLYAEKICQPFKASLSRHIELTLRVISKDALKLKSLEELENMERVDDYLFSGVWKYSCRTYIGNSMIGRALNDEIKNVISRLKVKYNEDFILLNSLEPLHYLCAPVKNTELQFECFNAGGDVVSDQYLSVLAQEYLDEKTDEILERNGLTETVVYLNALSEMGSVEYDTSELGGEVPFLNMEGEQDLDTSLYYFLDSSGSYDLEALRDTIEEIQELFPQPSGSYEKIRMHHIYVFFYSLSESDQKIIKALFTQEHNSMWKMQKEGGALDFETYQVTDRETDGFSYLYSHGVKADYILSIPHDIKGYPAKMMFEEFKTNDIWR